MNNILKPDIIQRQCILKVYSNSVVPSHTQGRYAHWHKGT